eukprot:1153391-Pelagomonas_calceolata.AAC.3
MKYEVSTANANVHARAYMRTRSHTNTHTARALVCTHARIKRKEKLRRQRKLSLHQLGKKETLAQKSHESPPPRSYKIENAYGDLESNLKHPAPGWYALIKGMLNIAGPTNNQKDGVESDAHMHTQSKHKSWVSIHFLLRCARDALLKIDWQLSSLENGTQLEPAGIKDMSNNVGKRKRKAYAGQEAACMYHSIDANEDH